MLPSRISPLRSPAAAASASHFQWQTPVASPFHSYYHTPLSSNNHSPILNSPIYAGGARYSPSLHKVHPSIYASYLLQHCYHFLVNIENSTQIVSDHMARHISSSYACFVYKFMNYLTILIL